MYTRPSAPRSIGGVLDDAVHLYRESLARCWPLSLLIALVAVLQSAQLLDLSVPTGGNAIASAQQTLALWQERLRSPEFWFTQLAYAAVDSVLYAALIALINAAASRVMLSVPQALEFALRRAGRILLLTLILFVLVSAGCMLLLAPGIYLAGALQLSTTALIIEDAGAVRSMGISLRLIRGHWWRAVTLISVVLFIMLVFYGLGGLVVGLLGLATNVLAGQLITAAVNTLVLSALPAALIAMYYDLKLRKDGGDLAQRARALPAE
jgi:hypothetical protein